ncbi:sugar transferase [Albimonas pacifica]|uniref:Sugar transferase involved in LPS biosynthesis (Colanic, teichoic acid) n=1 Tax=Albimonas pacifica TaxID=1114924 RepID=A0A1I3DWU7_9RHOB|nr:sugar transferase [Albimonas pacifica]SFH91224.1 Sugar transferase involved in LPS biosynthesis (colanic, teichoic acid) [Albimonas pacifica]
MAIMPPRAASRPHAQPAPGPLPRPQTAGRPGQPPGPADDDPQAWRALALRDAASWPNLRLVVDAALRDGETRARAAQRPPVFAPPRGLYATYAKRWLDLALVLAAAPIALPLVALLAAWVRLDPRSGRAPAFYGQVRVGRGGRRFTCWKIRTMAPDAEAELDRLLADDPAAAAEWERRQKLDRDPRVIPAGRLLRRSSLDELPQLWNVFTGDMSLVGPRPYTPPQRRMHAMPELYESLRPGLTGFWQIGPRGEGGDFALRAVEDARYWRELSLAADLRVILRTAAIVLRGDGR